MPATDKPGLEVANAASLAQFDRGDAESTAFVTPESAVEAALVEALQTAPVTPAPATAATAADILAREGVTLDDPRASTASIAAPGLSSDHLSSAVRDPQERKARRDPEALELTGVSGWLVLFVIGQVLVFGSGLYSLCADMVAYGSGTLTFTARQWAYLVVYDGVSGASSVAALVLLALIFGTHHATRRVALIVLPLNLIFQVVREVALGMVTESAGGTPTATENQESSLSLGRLIFYSIVWTVYWWRSRRVRHTFSKDNASRDSEGRIAPLVRGSHLRRIGLAFAAVSVCALLAFVVGVVRRPDSDTATTANNPEAAPAPGGSVEGTTPAAPAASGPTTDDAIVESAMRAAGGNVDSLFAAHRADDDASWFQVMSAAAVVTELSHAERRELLQLRASVVDRSDTEACGRYAGSGEGLNINLATGPERRRIIELAGTAVGRRVAGNGAREHKPVSGARFREIIEANLSPSEIARVDRGVADSATKPQACEALRALYRMALDLPSSGRDSRDAVYWALDVFSGREEAK
ncbi:MAG: DUF2569 family protein [Gemmatimonadaceae bacterium]|nr:DUF2569 family protein [Gemmatimonadaceae bacterium]